MTVRDLIDSIPGFSTISGSILGAYINLGVPAQNLITASVMSIPASIAISKIRMPELEEPVTRGRLIVDRGEEDTKHAPVNALQAFAKGAVFGLIVAGQILCNVLTILSLVATINGLLTWIGRGFGIHHLTLQLVIRYIFYPITFFLGTYIPRLPFCPSPYLSVLFDDWSLVFHKAFPAQKSCMSPSSSQLNSSRTSSWHTKTYRR